MQEIGVVLVVAVAVAYLIRKIFGRPRRGVSTFIPLSKVKKDDGCH